MGLGRAAEPSTSQLRLCCGKRAGKALHRVLGKVLGWDTGQSVPRTSDCHSRETEDVGLLSQTPFSLAQQHLVAQDMGNSHKASWVFVISTQKKMA